MFGKPRIGDQLAVIINPEDSAEALRVIDMEDLRSHWCYQILPHMRDISKMPKRLQRRMVAEMPDSEKQALMVPREVGYQLKRGYSITTTTDGKIVRDPKTLSNGETIRTQVEHGTITSVVTATE